MKKYIVSLCLLLAFFATTSLAATTTSPAPPTIISSMNCADRFALRPADAQEQLKVANEAVGVGQFEQARLIYERLVKAGFSGAMKNLGVLYAEGLGVQKDAARAEFWQKEAEKAVIIDTICMNEIHAKEGK